MSELNQLQQWRRAFHQIPERGWGEFMTTAKIITQLRDMGWDVLTATAFLSSEHILGRNENEVAASLVRAQAAGISQTLLDEMNGLTGCVAVWDSGRVGPITTLRFDIDCVAVSESDDESHIPALVGFTSKHPGDMHACGHDGHIAMGLGLARWVMRAKAQLCGKIKLVFQPAEEGVRGAKPVAEGGILDDSDYFLAAHIGMGVPSGCVAVAPTDFLCTTKLDFTFHGAPAHAGVNPHLGANALAGACHCVTQLLAIPRHGEGMSRINIGMLHAGEGRNIIPTCAKLQLEVRGETEAINRYMRERALSIAQGIALGFDLRFEYEVAGEATDLHNNPLLIELLANIASEELGLTLVEKSFGGSEDATLLVRRVQHCGGQAAYIVLGADIAAGHHEANFDFDESVLTHGVQIFASCISKLNGVVA